MRYLYSLLLGMVMAGFLFALMQKLVSAEDITAMTGTETQFVDFIRIKRSEETRTKDRRVPDKPEPPTKPPPPQIAATMNDTRPTPNLNMNLPRLAGSVIGGGPFLGNAFSGPNTGDGDVIPMYMVQPNTPREAVRGCLSGEVKVEFTILEDGSVENPSIISSNPPRLYDREVLRAIVKWKFRPRIVDGRPVARQASIPLTFEKPPGCQ